MANYAFTTNKDLPVIEDGWNFTNFNFMQKYPNTKIFEGKTDLTFKNCNLMNCDVPNGSTIISCLTTQKSLCSNLYPEFELSPACEENCSHVVDTDEIKIDGIVIDTTYHYEDTVL